MLLRRHWSGAPPMTHAPEPALLVQVAVREEPTDGTLNILQNN